MEITLNGLRTRTACQTLQEIVLEQTGEPVVMIVEYNEQVVHKPDWERTKIKEGDKIELLGFVGGG